MTRPPLLRRSRRWFRRRSRAIGEALGRAVIEQRRFEIMAANVENAERHRKAIRRTRPGRCKRQAPRRRTGKATSVPVQCKKRHQAKAALRRIQATGGREATPVRWYFCDFCHGYHLTSRP
jgi:hypothetical protein